MILFTLSGLLTTLLAWFAYYVLRYPEGEAASIAGDIYCMCAHRRDWLVIKRTPATETLVCPHCKTPHLRIRPDAFD